MKFKITEVPIEEIDRKNFSFKITTDSTTKDIAKSINCTGLLSCPYLVKKGNSYVIVSGFRRIASCSSLSYTNIPAKIISDEVSQFECAKLAISDNAFQRKLNIVEKSRCYRILTDSIEDVNLIDSLGTSLGFLFSTSAVKKIKPVCSLSWTIQEGLIQGYISLPTALKIGKMPPWKTGVFVELFKILNTTLNNQLEIMNLMIEISMKSNTSIEHLFFSRPIKEILNNSGSRPQKTNFIRSYLKKLCYPIMTATFHEFNKKLKELRLNKNVELTPPRFFEGEIYSLRINFKNYDELRKCKEDIDKIVNNPDLLNCI